MAARKAAKKKVGAKALAAIGTAAVAAKKATNKAARRSVKKSAAKSRAQATARATEPGGSLAPAPVTRRAAKKASGRASATIKAKASAGASKRAVKLPSSGVKASKAASRARPAKLAKAPPAASGSTAGVSEGQPAPAFSLPDQAGQALSSASLAGAPYVLYFYPKDDTPGCTKEACDFRDAMARFAGRGVRVLGVSPDSGKSHTRFREKYGLNFTLLSDSDKRLAEQYGVWVKKQNYGREYMGIARSTFLIDGSGVVRKVWRNVRVPGHIDAVLDEAERLV